MKTSDFKVREANQNEFSEIGKLMVDVYSRLEGFPNKIEQPDYYRVLANVGNFTNNPATKLLIASSPNDTIGGAVVFFSDMSFYGSGGAAPQEKNASGFRLLAVNPNSRGKGIGSLLTKACIQLAKNNKHKHLIIHTTESMQIAWAMYEKMGFKRFERLDFKQGTLLVYGFKLIL